MPTGFPPTSTARSSRRFRAFRCRAIATSGSGRLAHRIASSLQRFRPDVVHLASPFALGWRGVLAAERLGIPSAAAYQTDVAAYTERYRIAATTGIAQSHISRLHRRATLTLAPSADSAQQLAELGWDRVRRWGRGVDAERFQPARRDAALRASWGQRS
nr:glycosyltransferase [Microbacterium sp. Se63.02b]